MAYRAKLMQTNGGLKGRGLPERIAEIRAEEIFKELSASKLKEFLKEAPQSSTTFYGDEKGMFIPAYCILAAMKEASSVLGYTEMRGFRDCLKHGVKVLPAKIYLRNPSNPEEILQVPDGIIARPIHVVTARGKRSSVVYYPIVRDCLIEFQVWVAPGKASEIINKDVVYNLLTHAAMIGLWTARVLQFGRAVMIDFEDLGEKNPTPEELLEMQKYIIPDWYIKKLKK